MTSAWLPPDHDRWTDATGAYVLNALPPDEVDGFEGHLTRCAVCRDEVVRLRLAAEALPGFVAQLSPPPELKERIMAVVAREAAEVRAAAPAAAPAPAPLARPRRRRSWLPEMRLRPLALAPALGLVLGLGVLAGLLLSGDDERGRASTVLAQVDGRAAPDGSARLVRDGDLARLEVDGLPAPGPGRAYQVWLKPPGGDPEPTDALFTVRPDGSASIAVPGDVGSMEAVLVTEEPRSGSKVPSGAPVIAASLS